MAQDDINDLYAQIKSFLLQHGPSLMVDIASGIGKDTMQAGAILDYFVARGSLQRTGRKYGFSSIYFLSDQKDAALSKLYDTLNSAEKAIVEKFKASKVIDSDSLSPAERYLVQNLSDFVRKLSAVDRDTGERRDLFVYYGVSNEMVDKIINKKEEAQIQPSAKVSQSREKKSVQRASLDEVSIVVSAGFASPAPLDKHIFMARYGQYSLPVIVAVFSKKKPAKSDVAKVAGYASKNRTVAFILSPFAVTGSDYGSIITPVKI